jgi:uncharacterized protein YjlB
MAKVTQPTPVPALESHLFPDDGLIPNHPTLPLICYRGAFAGLPEGEEPPFEHYFKQSGWEGTWRWGVYGFHHYHSNAHEVLGVVRGSATIRFGGATGKSCLVSPGDMVVIPAGVGHRNEGSSAGFCVVGAYPSGQNPDLCRDTPEEYRRAAGNIASVPLPASDPLYGEAGPLMGLWQNSEQ